MTTTVPVSGTREAELTKRYTVGNDGAFDFPHIGRVEAKGLTLRNLEELIGRRLVDGRFSAPGAIGPVLVYDVRPVRAKSPFGRTVPLTSTEPLAWAKAGAAAKAEPRTRAERTSFFMSYLQ